MIKRTITGALIFLVTAGVLVAEYFWGSRWFSAVWAIVTVICVIETNRALKKKLPVAVTVLSVIYALALSALSAGEAFGIKINDISQKEYLSAVCFFILATAFCITGRKDNDSVIYTALLTVYPVMPLVSLQKLALLTAENAPYRGITLLVLVFAVASLTDVFAYLFGRFFGRRKLTTVSPNKTVEGALGGLLGGIIGSALVFVVFETLSVMNLGIKPNSPVVFYVLAGIIGSAFTQTGDLIASMLKRTAGIKDYSRLLGSHGGFMDRFDGTMMSAVLVYLLAVIAL